MTDVVAALREVCVHFRATRALDRLSLDFHRGEIHALVGENGAGKSTAVRVLAGVLAPAAGEVVRPAAIAWAPQETLLPPELRVDEWIHLGREPRRALRLLDRRKMATDAAAALQAVGANLPVGARLGWLSTPQRKQVQLARSLAGHPDLLLIDEPTAALGAAESEAVFAALRQARRHGASVVYVSHHLPEVLRLADRVSVLRDGALVATHTADVSAAQLIAQMVGREVLRGTRRAATGDEVLLRCSNVCVAQVDGLELEVHAGEIVGLAGLVGSGRSEVLETIAGLRRQRAGTIEIATRPVLLPEDRNTNGLVPAFSVRENLFTPAAGWWLSRRNESHDTRAWIDRLRIRVAGTEPPIGDLSGGNQQKVLLARCLRRTGKLLLLDEPTAGIDIGAKAEIHAIVRAFADDGGGVLMASSELPELLGLCDRIAALRSGRRITVFDAADANEASLVAAIV